LTESPLIPQGLPKAERYQLLLQSAEALLADETNAIARMSNLAALLHHNFPFFWTGFYLLEISDLVLGPFQGPVACLRIPVGKGVCGTAWQNQASIVVPNVDAYPGHIACSAESKSEIVIPFTGQQFKGVLDIDSKELNAFDSVDQYYLELLLLALLGRSPNTYI